MLCPLASLVSRASLLINLQILAASSCNIRSAATYILRNICETYRPYLVDMVCGEGEYPKFCLLRNDSQWLIGSLAMHQPHSSSDPSRLTPLPLPIHTAKATSHAQPRNSSVRLMHTVRVPSHEWQLAG